MSLKRACSLIFRVILNPPWRMNHQELTCESTLRFISRDWNLPLALSTSWPFLFPYGFIFNDRNKVMHELLRRNIKCLRNKLYGQLDVTLCVTSSVSRFSGFLSGPLGCAAFCVTVIEYGGNRGNALWDLVIGVSPWNPGDYRLCKYFHFQFIWNEKEDGVYWK
jgi:hypothetical protein